MVSGPPSDHPLDLNFGDLHTFTSRRMSSPSPDHGELHEKSPKEPTEDSCCATPTDDQTHGEELANTENAAEPSAARLRHREMGRQAAARFRENKRQYSEVLLEREAVSRKQRSDLREEILCMRETLMEYQTLLMRHKDCPQYRAMGGYCGHQILASIERFKGLFDYAHEDEDIRSLRAEFLGEPNVQLLPTPPPNPPVACDCKLYRSLGGHKEITG